MATQIIDTSTDTPVTADDYFILADTGSISSNDAGTALTLSGGFNAYIDGGVYMIGGYALVTDSPSSSASLVIGENGSVVAIGQIVKDSPLPSIVAVNLTDTIESLTNRGVIDGAGTGVLLFSSTTDDVFDSAITNSGDIRGDIAIATGTLGSSLTLNNEATGVIEGETNSIFMTGELDLNNDGTIIGDIILPTTAFSPTSGEEAPSAKIVNNGSIVATSDIAIALADGKDKVKNKGTIDGDIHLGGGKDKYVGGKDSVTVYGDAGKDTIKGGKGKETIVHEVGDGKDKLFKFKPGKDRLDLSDHDFSGFADLRSSMTDKGNKVVIDLTGSDKITLKGVDLDDLGSGDFVI